jgi:ribosomal-protein-alanine N-acetyltransferase
MSFIVRPMQLDDVPHVSQIDREAFPTDWPPPSFRKELNSPVIRYIVVLDDTESRCDRVEAVEHNAHSKWRSLVSRVGRLLNKGLFSNRASVAQDNKKIVGYAAVWLMADEAHLTSIAVRQTYRRQGIGELLLISIIKVALQMKARMVTLETRVSNIGAQSLYEKYGFAKVGMRRRYYSDNGEDAVIMTTDNMALPPYQARFVGLERKYIEKYGQPGCQLARPSTN